LFPFHASHLNLFLKSANQGFFVLQSPSVPYFNKP
jgi:hypothetical protein